MDELSPGTILGHRYETRRVIARGGICVVLAAEHTYTGRLVAIKRLDKQWQQHDGAKARMLREARALELTHHPNVVDILDAGLDEVGQPFLVMEYLTGRTLGGLLTTKLEMSQADVVSVGLDMCQALRVAHARGIVHRDVKPHNVVFTRDRSAASTAKLIDFGIARMESSAEKPGELTQPGEVLGTPNYMAPELLSLEGPVTPSADVYSLGVVLYEALTGKVVFEGKYGEVLVKALKESPVPVSELRTDVHPALEEVVMRALKRSPADRFEDMAAFGAALQRAQQEIERKASTNHAVRGAQIPSIPVVQRRAFERQPYVTPVRIVQEDGVVVDGRSQDISEGGLLVLTERAIANDVKGKIRFSLPLSGQLVTVSVMMRWVKAGRGRFAAGLQFENLESPVQLEIGRFVELMRGAST